MSKSPSVLHLKHQLQPFKSKQVKHTAGYGAIPTAWLNGKKLHII